MNSKCPNVRFELEHSRIASSDLVGSVEINRCEFKNNSRNIPLVSHIENDDATRGDFAGRRNDFLWRDTLYSKKVG